MKLSIQPISIYQIQTITEENNCIWSPTRLILNIDKYKKGSSCFLSTTKRIEHKSDVPGPGSYDANYIHFTSENKFSSFGTTSERKTDLNRTVDQPSTSPTFINNPPVGYYNKPQNMNVNLNINTNKSNDHELIYCVEINLQSFNSTSKRECMKNIGIKKKYFPGPGQYDLSFSDELKTLDHQLSVRYRTNPFGSNSPRFFTTQKVALNKKNPKISFSQNRMRTSPEKQLKNKIIDE